MSHLLRSSCMLVLVAAACGGRAPAPPSSPAAVAPMPEDLSIERPPATLTGTVFRPEFIALIEMKPVRSQGTTVARARAAWKKLLDRPRTSIETRTRAAQLLASTLWRASERSADRSEALAEARAAIAAVAPAEQLDSASLQMAAALALASQDELAAAPFLDALIARRPPPAIAGAARAQRGLYHVRNGDNAAADPLVADAQVDVREPEVAYLLAWTRLRAADARGAAAAASTALSHWRRGSSAPVLRDYLLMTARAGLDPAPAATAIEAVLAGGLATGGFERETLHELSQAYALAGHPALAATAIDLALASDDRTPPATIMTYRLEQAEALRAAGAIDRLTATWKAGHDACRACSASELKDFGDRLAALAVELHTVFVTTGDRGYRRAATGLYALFATLPDRADAPQVAGYARDLAAATAPDSCGQYGEGLAAPIATRQPEIAACYDAILQGAPTLAGSIKLVLELAQDGAVEGVSLDPAAGEAGLAAVSRCVEARARGWRFPSRPRPGMARLTLVYELNPPS